MSKRDEASFILRLIDKVTGPSKVVDKALGRMGAAMSRLRGDAKKSDKALGRFKDASGKLREKNGRFVGGGGKGGGGLFSGGALDVLKGNILTAALGKIGDLAVGIATGAAELVTFGQNARLAFDQLAKHGSTGEKLFEHSRALATRFGLDVLDTTKQYQKFLALQFDPKEADKLIKMGADLRVLGNSAEDVKGVFTALGQIKSKGKFQAEEMLQLAERGISGTLVWEEIGKSLGGKSVDEVRKLQEQGKITADVALGAIESAINRKLGQNALGESGARFADQTLDGFIGRAKAFGQDAGIKLVDKITAPLTKLGSAGIGKLEGFLFSPEGAATIETIANGLGKAAEFGADFVGAFGSGFGDAFTVLGEAVKPVLGMFGEGEGDVAREGLREFGKLLGYAGAVALGAVGAFMGLTAGVGFLGSAILTGTAAAIDWLGQNIGDIILWWDNVAARFDALGPTFSDKAMAIGKSIVTGLGNGIVALATYPIDKAAEVGSAILGKLRSVFDSHSPSRAAGDIGYTLPQGLAKGSDRGIGMVERAGADMADAYLGSAATASSSSWGLGPGTTDPELFGPEAGSFARPPGFDTVGGGAGQGRGVVVHLQVDVHAAGGDPAETGRLVALETRRELEAYFRQLDAES